MTFARASAKLTNVGFDGPVRASKMTPPCASRTAHSVDVPAADDPDDWQGRRPNPLACTEPFGHGVQSVPSGHRLWVHSMTCCVIG